MGGRLPYASLHQELLATVIFYDSSGAFGLKMIHPTFSDPDKISATNLPHLHGKIIIAAHARAELNAVPAHFQPIGFADNVGRPCASVPVFFFETIKSVQ